MSQLYQICTQTDPVFDFYLQLILKSSRIVTSSAFLAHFHLKSSIPALSPVAIRWLVIYFNLNNKTDAILNLTFQFRSKVHVN